MMAVAVALMVQGVVITSSPGSIPIAPTAQTSPLVQELTEIACLTPNFLLNLFSSAFTDVPPKNFLMPAPKEVRQTAGLYDLLGGHDF